MRHHPLVLLTALVFAMAACDSSDDASTTAPDASSSEAATTTPTVVATTSVPDTSASEVGEAQETSVEVFSFTDDDLCEWVTQEELTGFITEALDWNGSAIQTPPDAPAKCEWRVVGDEEGEIGFVEAYDATRELQTWENQPFDFAALDVVEFSDSSPLEGGETAVSGHPDLSDGVVAYNYGYGIDVFWVPPRDEYLALSFPLISGASEIWGDAAYFAVADQILRELAWVD